MALVSKRWQRRKQNDGRTPYVLAERGDSSFTMKVSDQFQEALRTIAEAWGDDDWSKAEIIRELVYREAGVPRQVTPFEVGQGRSATEAAQVSPKDPSSKPKPVVWSAAILARFANYPPGMRLFAERDGLTEEEANAQMDKWDSAATLRGEGEK